MKYIVEFKGNRRAIYNSPDSMEIKSGKYVVVQAERGEDMGIVHRKAKPDENGSEEKIFNIIRLATEYDIDRLKFNRQKEQESKAECLKFIEKHRLKMKLVDVEYQFDCNKITFYFTAEKRVDFRELVKDLATTFRTRIELRQIGVRDEAKMLGGFGVCGKEQCCSSFLNEFYTISTQMARTQNLALNPQKISGNCGRLLCCLQYEQEFYETIASEYPPLYSRCKYDSLDGTISKRSIFFEKITINFTDGGQKILSLAEYKRDVRKGRLKLVRESRSDNSRENSDKINNLAD